MLSKVSLWLGGLRVGRKLMLIYLLDLTAVIYVSGLLVSEKLANMDLTRREVLGTAYVQVVQQNLMAHLLPSQLRPEDVARLRERLAAARSAHDVSLHTTDVSVAFVQSLPENKAQAEQAPMSLPLSVERGLIESARALLTVVGNQSNLISDPDLDSYYIMSIALQRLPDLVQALHEGRALAQKLDAIDDPHLIGPSMQLELLSQTARIEVLRQSMAGDLAQATLAGGERIPQALGPQQAQLQKQLQSYQVLLAWLARGDTSSQEAAAQLLKSNQASLLLLDEAWQQSLRKLAQLLDARQYQLHTRTALHLGTALVLLLVILSVVSLVARNIATPLSTLAKVAEQVRLTADYSQRAHWSSTDEIGRLFSAFNAMLAQLNEHRLTQQELVATARAAAAQKELVEAFPIPMLVTSMPDHRVLHVNTPGCPWVGNCKGNPWRTGMDNAVRNRFFQRLADQGAVDEFEVHWCGGGEPAWSVLSARRLVYQGQDAVLTAFTPVNKLKAMEQHIRFLAMHDALTQLPNRALCQLRLKEALSVAQPSGEQVAVLFIDLDHFKPINDTLGHQMGDKVLRVIAQRLCDAVRGDDTVSRLGGDEFVVILRQVSGRKELDTLVMQRFISAIRQPIVVEGHTLSVSCSVGIALYPHDAADPTELMRQADSAMYVAKSSGRDTARHFSAEIDQQVQSRQNMKAQLRSALANQEFTLHFQPRLCARTHQVRGAEALLRWNNAVLGHVAPDDFITLAEESGLIKSIGRWVLMQACRQWVAMADQLGMAGLQLSVNLSAAQLADERLVSLVRSTLAHTGLTPAQLELELTESHLMSNPTLAQAQVSALKALGVSVSVDDFGTGHSSLAYLKRFEIDKLKIDQSLVREMLEDEADSAIVQAVVGLGHTLKLHVVAEGVESLAIAQALTALGCNELQGYAFARPLPEKEFLQWVVQHRGPPLARAQSLQNTPPSVPSVPSATYTACLA